MTENIHTSSTLTRRRALAVLAWSGLAFSAPRALALAPPVPRDVTSFGVVCDKATDGTEAMQRAMDWASREGSTILIPGPVLVTGTLRYESGLDLKGVGREAGLFAPNLPSHSPLLAPKAAAGSRVKKLKLSNLKFIGSGRQLEAPIALVRLDSTDDIKIENCTFADHKFIMLGLFGCTNVVIQGCEFSNWGRAAGEKPQGPALHITASQGNVGSSSVQVLKNDFHDGDWVAVSVYGRDVSVVGNTIRHVKEGGIFAFRDRPGDLSNSAAVNLSVLNNVIDVVTRSLISATGIEVGPNGGTVSGNRISNTQSSGILLLNPARGVMVSGNTITNTVRDPKFFRRHAQLQLIGVHQTPDWPDTITIENNTVVDTANPKVAPYAIAVHAPEQPVRPMNAIRISGNQIKSGFVIAATSYDPGLVDGGSVQRE